MRFVYNCLLLLLSTFGFFNIVTVSGTEVSNERKTTFCVEAESCDCKPDTPPSDARIIHVQLPLSDELLSKVEETYQMFEETMKSISSFQIVMNNFKEYISTATVPTTITPNCVNTNDQTSIKDTKIEGKAVVNFKILNDKFRNIEFKCKDSNGILMKEETLIFDSNENIMEQSIEVPYPSLCAYYITECKQLHSTPVYIHELAQINVEIVDCNEYNTKSNPLTQMETNDDESQQTEQTEQTTKIEEIAESNKRANEGTEIETETTQQSYETHEEEPLEHEENTDQSAKESETEINDENDTEKEEQSSGNESNESFHETLNKDESQSQEEEPLEQEQREEEEDVPNESKTETNDDESTTQEERMEEEDNSDEGQSNDGSSDTIGSSDD